jgi:two-component system response regulator BaeR
MSAAIMIAEDEPELAAVIADYAHAAGYLPTIHGDGAQALAAIRQTPPDLIVLDLMLPGMDGLSLCRAVRALSSVPIIMVTARVEEIDRLLGLELGADDYLCKPFSPRELMARIKAILRRAGVTPATLQFNEDAHSVKVQGHALDLTPSEYAILAALARRPGQVLSRAQLLDAARADNLDATDRAIDSHVKNLRRKIETLAPGLEPIRSIYGLGYRYDA